MVSTSVMAAEFAKFEVVKGTVMVGQKAAKVGMKVEDQAVIVTSDKSFAKLETTSGSKIILGPKAAIKIDSKEKKAAPVQLARGAIRWVSSTADKGKLTVRTKEATMGVRGTDFFTARNKLLAETEIICFDGAVEFTNQANTKDRKLIKKGQWGGIGGRFTGKIGGVLDLPPNILNAFSKQVPSNLE